MKLINGETESLRKGKWSPEEDQKLLAYVTRYGIWNWSLMPKAAGLLRSGKSCRLRWMNYLRPTIKRERFSIGEIEMITKLQESLGNKWSKIAEKMHGRTDNDIKNFWNTHIRKCLRTNTKAVCNNRENSCVNGPKKRKERSKKIRTSESPKETIHVSQENHISESFSFSEQSNSSRDANGDLEGSCTNKLTHKEVEWNNNFCEPFQMEDWNVALNNLCPNFEEPDWRLRDHELTIKQMCINDDMNSYWFDHLLEEAYSGGYL